MTSDFETVFTTLDWHQAQVFKGRLEAAGILIYVGDEHTSLTAPGVFGGFRICVPEERAREAREILAAIQAGKFALDE